MKELEFYWRDTHPLIDTMMWIEKTDLYKDVPGCIAGENTVFVRDDTDTRVFLTPEGRAETVASGQAYLDPEQAASFFTKSASFRRKYDAFIHRVRNMDVRLLDRESVATLIEELWKTQLEGWAYYEASQPEALHHAEERLRELVHGSEDTVQLLTTPPIFDKIQEQEMAWMQLVIDSDLFTPDLFSSHAWKYPFIFRNTYDIMESYALMKKRFDEDVAKRDQFREELARMHKRKRDLKIEQERVLKKGDEKLKHITRVFQQSALERMNLKYVWAGVHEILFRDVYMRAAELLEEEFEILLKYHRPEEILARLRGTGERPDIESRKLSVYTGMIDGKFFFYDGEEARTLIRKNHPEIYEQARDVLKGTPACPGIVKGEVFLMPLGDLADVHRWSEEMKPGQIIVTAMTQPSLVPLMAKAGAIVTDEGGLTSHAAVVSRELHVPCVVGTHYATVSLKTGDTVEVDALKGIVRKIS